MASTDPIHVMPVEDWEPHTCSPNCFCNPTFNPSASTYIHHSLKGLEVMEAFDSRCGGNSLS